MWAGRFSQELNADFEQWQRSFPFDRILVPYEVAASQAHAAALAKAGVLTSAELSLTQKALDRMAHYLGRGMRLIVAGLAPERIVVVGDLTRSWHRFGSIIEAAVQAQVLPGGIAPRIVPAYEDGMARLRGTVALVLQKHFSV